MILERAVIEVPGPFAAGRFFGFLAARAIDGVESVSAEGAAPVYARTLMLPGGPGAVRVQHRGGSLHVTLEVRTPACAVAGLGAVRRIFDVDAPIREIDRHLLEAGGPPVVEEGVRLPGAHDLHEILIRAIVGQQITVARARAHLVRLAHAYGAEYRPAHPDVFPALSRMFPTPQRLVDGLAVPGPGERLDPDRVLRLPRRSIGAVVHASDACLAPEMSTDSLTELPGVGPWTAGYVRMRYLPDRDAWLPGDVALIAGAKNLDILPQDLPTRAAHRELEAVSERWRPWRAYAAMRLWANAARRKE